MTTSISKPFINFHIPKTAGTSLRAALISGFGPEKVAFMMPDRQLAKTSDLPFKTEQLDRARREARAMGQLAIFSERVSAINRMHRVEEFSLAEIGTRGIAVATGHFLHSDITAATSDIPRATVLRDPLERAWSHYSHWREAKGTMWWHDGDVAYADGVTFETFATDQKIINYQANCLGGLSCDVVGTSDNLHAFLEEIGLCHAGQVPELNPGNYKETPTFDVGFVRDFKALNAADYELYEAAKR